MLGRFKLKRTWKWAAFGKHPVVRDYFATCNEDPIFKAVSTWVEKGYQSLPPNEKEDNRIHSHRFWMKGPKNDLILGSLHDSSDSIGRTFPLLIIGTGPFKDWEKNWDMMPVVCHKTWERIDYLACKRYDDLKFLESDLATIPSPQVDEYLKVQVNSAVPDSFLADMAKQLTELVKTGRTVFKIPLKTADPIEVSTAVHTYLKSQMKKLTPNSTFITAHASEFVCLTFFMKPLTTESYSFLRSDGR